MVIGEHVLIIDKNQFAEPHKVKLLHATNKM